jgi:hypothetical protein
MLRLALAHAEEDTGATQEPHASEETDKCETCGGPQEGLEELCGSFRGVRLRDC